MTIQIDGYAPSDRQLVCAPTDVESDVLCKTVKLYDRFSNCLEVNVTYEQRLGCIHALSLHAAYWVGATPRPP